MNSKYSLAPLLFIALILAQSVATASICAGLFDSKGKRLKTYFTQAQTLEAEARLLDEIFGPYEPIIVKMSKKYAAREKIDPAELQQEVSLHVLSSLNKRRDQILDMQEALYGADAISSPGVRYMLSKQLDWVGSMHEPQNLTRLVRESAEKAIKRLKNEEIAESIYDPTLRNVYRETELLQDYRITFLKILGNPRFFNELERRVIYTHVFEGLHPQEIAEAINRSDTRVYQIISSGLRKIQRISKVKMPAQSFMKLSEK